MINYIYNMYKFPSVLLLSSFIINKVIVCKYTCWYRSRLFFSHFVTSSVLEQYFHSTFGVDLLYHFILNLLTPQVFKSMVLYHVIKSPVWLGSDHLLQINEESKEVCQLRVSEYSLSLYSRKYNIYREILFCCHHFSLSCHKERIQTNHVAQN
jgi:hypothetical protein